MERDGLLSCIGIPIESDSVYEGREDFTVDIAQPVMGLTTGWPSQTTVVIIDAEGNNYT